MSSKYIVVYTDGKRIGYVGFVENGELVPLEVSYQQAVVIASIRMLRHPTFLVEILPV